MGFVKGNKTTTLVGAPCMASWEKPSMMIVKATTFKSGNLVNYGFAITVVLINYYSMFQLCKNNVQLVRTQTNHLLIN